MGAGLTETGLACTEWMGAARACVLSGFTGAVMMGTEAAGMRSLGMSIVGIRAWGGSTGTGLVATSPFGGVTVGSSGARCFDAVT